MKKKIEEILGVNYVTPHSPADGVAFKEGLYQCGDCFCTIQKVHTHSHNERLVKPLLDLFKKHK